MTNRTETPTLDTNGQLDNPITEAFSAPITLEDKLAILNEKQMKAVYEIYKREVDSTQLSELAEEIETDPDKKRSKKLIGLIDDNYKHCLPERGKYNQLKIAASEATKEKNRFKKTMDSREATFTNELLGFTKSEEEIIKAEVEAELVVAIEKREKIRKRGIQAYLDGIVAAVIDDCHEEYTAEANKKALIAVKVATPAINALSKLPKNKKVDSKSMDGYRMIRSSVSKSIKGLEGK